MEDAQSQMPRLWRLTVQNRNYFNNSPGLEVDASGLAVVPALIRRLSMPPMRLPLERWIHSCPIAPCFPSTRSPTYLRITTLPATVPTNSETSLLELGLSERFFEQGLWAMKLLERVIFESCGSACYDLVFVVELEVQPLVSFLFACPQGKTHWRSIVRHQCPRTSTLCFCVPHQIFYSLGGAK